MLETPALEFLPPKLLRVHEFGLLANKQHLRVDYYMRCYLDTVESVDYITMEGLENYVILLGVGYFLAGLVLIAEIAAFRKWLDIRNISWPQKLMRNLKMKLIKPPQRRRPVKIAWQ